MVESVPTLALFRGTALLLGGEAAAALPPPLRSVYFLPEPEPDDSGANSLLRLALLLLVPVCEDTAELLACVGLEVSWTVQLCDVLAVTLSVGVSCVLLDRDARDLLRLLDVDPFFLWDFDLEVELSALAALAALALGVGALGFTGALL